MVAITQKTGESFKEYRARILNRVKEAKKAAKEEREKEKKND